MLFNGKLINDIDEEDILALIEYGYSEIKTREFKLVLPGNSDNEKKEFLADISSFANASGGFIIYGVKEENGIAIAIQGMQIIDQDSEKLRIESIIQNGIQPRIPGISIHTILLKDNAYIFVIFIPQSWIGPHMVTFQNNSKFFSRNSSGKYQFDVNEIKQAMLGFEGVANNIRNFRTDRLSKIIAGETPIQINSGAKIVLHIIPIQSFLQNSDIPIEKLVKDATKIETLSTRSNNCRINLDGLVVFYKATDGTNYSYTQVFRNGVIELVDGFLLGRKEKPLSLPITILESNVLNSCISLLNLTNSYNIEPPFIIFLSLIGVKGYKFLFSQKMESHLFLSGDENNLEVDRDMIIIPEIILETDITENIHEYLKPIFNSIWNASGYRKSFNYDDKGNWNPQ